MGLLEELKGLLVERVSPPALPQPAPAPKKELVTISYVVSEDAAALITRNDSQLAAERADDPANIAKLREAVRTGRATKFGGTVVDVFSASAAIQVYDALSESNRKKMGAMPVKKMMSIVFKMLAKRVV
jgi:hypothetical protein